MRALAALRESRTDDHGTSLDGQREHVTRWAEANGHVIVHITADASTSGATPPFQRPNLGPWLTQPELLSQFDILVTSKLDRVSRSTVDFGSLLKHLEKHGKTYASVTEGIDLSTPIGKVIGGILMVFAEFELEQIKVRCQERSERHKINGTWNGGVLPFGWKAVEQGRAYRLEPDESQVPVVRDISARFAGGETTASLARWLNAQGIRTARKAAWTANAVRKVLLNDTTGDLLSNEEAQALRARLDYIGSQPVSERNGNAYLLTGVIKCGLCDGPVNVSWKANRGYGYSRCPKGHVQYRTDVVDAAMEAFMLADNRPMGERVYIPGDDHSLQIHELEQKMKLLESVPEVDPAPVADRLAELKKQPHEPGHWVTRPVTPAVTVSRHWAALDVAQKNEMLRTWNTVMDAGRDSYVIWSDLNQDGDMVQMSWPGKNAAEGDQESSLTA